MAERSFAGFTYQQRLAVGVFGAVYRAHDQEGREARIVHVDDTLAGRDAFSAALLRFAAQPAVLTHPRVVAVRKVGRDDDRLIVVTEAVSGPVSLADILARAATPLAPDIALALAVGVIEGLAHAQSLGVVHGGVHPRSVLVDFHGGARLSDFALAAALADAAVADDGSDLFAGLRGYVAPELAIGGGSTEATDVYAAGALLHHLLVGRPPLGASALAGPPAIAALVVRALASDPAQRFVNATELEEVLEEAIVADGVRVAPSDEVARAVIDLLARDSVELADDAASARRAPSSSPVARARSEPGVPRRRGLTALLAEMDDGEEESVTRSRIGGPVEPTQVEADHTQVDDGWSNSAAPSAIDPIAKIIEQAPALDRPRTHDPSDDERTPLPPPSSGEGTMNRNEGETTNYEAWAAKSERQALAAVDQLLEEPTAEAKAKSSAAPSAPFAAAPIAPPAPARAVALEPEPSAAATDHEQPSLRRARSAMWSAIAVFAVGVLVAVLYTQRDRQADQAADDAVADRAEAAALLEAQRTNPGELIVESNVPEAAVWLSLGRTPTRSMALPSNMVHEIRLELEGHRALDLAVTAQHWSGIEGNRRAAIGATLVPGDGQSAPAFPPAPAVPHPAGPPGKGVIEVTSDPPGAEVWMLVGATPTATLGSVEAGKAYAFKLNKAGHRPAFAEVKPEDWYLSGPGGALKRSIRRVVNLEKVAPPAKRKKRR